MWTIAQAAKKLGKSRGVIHWLIKQGRIPARQLGGKGAPWVVDKLKIGPQRNGR